MAIRAGFFRRDCGDANGKIRVFTDRAEHTYSRRDKIRAVAETVTTFGNLSALDGFRVRAFVHVNSAAETARAAIVGVETEVFANAVAAFPRRVLVLGTAAVVLAVDTITALPAGALLPVLGDCGTGAANEIAIARIVTADAPVGIADDEEVVTVARFVEELHP